MAALCCCCFHALRRNAGPGRDLATVISDCSEELAPQPEDSRIKLPAMRKAAANYPNAYFIFITSKTHELLPSDIKLK